MASGMWYMLMMWLRSGPAGCWPYSRFIVMLLLLADRAAAEAAAAAAAEADERDDCCWLRIMESEGCIIGPGETGSDLTLESLGLWLWQESCEPGWVRPLPYGEPGCCC